MWITKNILDLLYLQHLIFADFIVATCSKTYLSGILVYISKLGLDGNCKTTKFVTLKNSLPYGITTLHVMDVIHQPLPHVLNTQILQHSA